jgi:hypothetical protein
MHIDIPGNQSNQRSDSATQGKKEEIGNFSCCNFSLQSLIKEKVSREMMKNQNSGKLERRKNGMQRRFWMT